jgi:DNA-directed RNA polymerase subunit RPC12/RpoP
MNAPRELWLELEKKILGGAAEVTQLRCPNCGGSLRIRFSALSGHAAIGIACLSCSSRSNLDGSFPEPRWVTKLGSEFTT